MCVCVHECVHVFVRVCVVCVCVDIYFGAYIMCAYICGMRLHIGSEYLRVYVICMHTSVSV